MITRTQITDGVWHKTVSLATKTTPDISQAVRSCISIFALTSPTLDAQPLTNNDQSHSEDAKRRHSILHVLHPRSSSISVADTGLTSSASHLPRFPPKHCSTSARALTLTKFEAPASSHDDDYSPPSLHKAAAATWHIHMGGRPPLALWEDPGVSTDANLLTLCCRQHVSQSHSHNLCARHIPLRRSSQASLWPVANVLTPPRLSITARLALLKSTPKIHSIPANFSSKSWLEGRHIERSSTPESG